MSENHGIVTTGKVFKVIKSNGQVKGIHLNRIIWDSSSLEMFRASLDRAQGNLVWWKVSVPVAGSGTGWALWSLPSQTLLGLPGKLLESTSLHLGQPSLMLNFAESSSVLGAQVATLRGVTFTQSTQQVPKPPGIRHPEAEHHQALAALGSSSLAQGCSRSQKRDKDPTPAPHTLLPQGHLPSPRNVVTSGTNTRPAAGPACQEL